MKQMFGRFCSFLVLVPATILVPKNIFQEQLDVYKRPTTVLAIALSDEQYDQLCDISTHYDTTIVMLDDERYSALERRCAEHAYCNILVLSGKCKFGRLRRLTECEHFDVAYVGERVFTNPFPLMKRKIEVISLLADHVYLMFSSQKLVGADQKNVVSNNKEYQEIKRILHATHAVALSAEDGFSTWYLPGKRTYLKRAAWWKLPAPEGTFTIVSNFNQKLFVKKCGDTHKSETWIKGINLATFKILEGVYPSRELLWQQVMHTKNGNHDDWAPHNMIIQGTHIEMIDMHDMTSKIIWPWPENAMKKFVFLKDSHEILRYVQQLKNNSRSVYKKLPQT